MQGHLIELEHFRVLLKSSGHGLSQFPFWLTESAQPWFAGDDFRQLVPVHLRQGKPILFFILPCTSVPPSLAHSLFFAGGEQRHRTESAAPLNPFIGTENRIIWLSVLRPQVRDFSGCGIWHPLCADFAAAGSGRHFFRKICSQLLHSYNALAFRFILSHFFGAFPSS
jgi:hypothetical protein